MNKLSKKYLQLYQDVRQEYFEEFGEHHPPVDFKEFEEDNLEILEKHLDIENPELKTSCYIALLDNTDKFAFYIAFQNQDFQKLNNAIYQYARRNLLRSAITASGTNHSIFSHNLFSAFACNDFSVIENFFPKDLPPTKGTYYTENICNLVKVLYYKQEDLKQDALQKAKKYLTKKLSALEKYLVLYFIGLTERIPEQCSESLQELCSAFQRQAFPVSKLDKCFTQEIHGIYRFARIIDEELFAQITFPTHHSVLPEFEQWQKENSYPQGELFYIYPEKLDYMNQIFRAELPKVELQEKGKYKDEKKFLADLTQHINQK